MKDLCRQIRHLLPDFLREELPAEEMEIVRRHLDACGGCREALAGLEGLLALVRERTATEVSADFRQRTGARAQAWASSAWPAARPLGRAGLIRRFAGDRLRVWGAAVAVHAAAILLLACFYIPYQAARTSDTSFVLDPSVLDTLPHGEQRDLRSEYAPPQGRIDATTGINQDLPLDQVPEVAETGRSWPRRTPVRGPQRWTGVDSPDFTRRLGSLGGRVASWVDWRVDPERKDRARERAGAREMGRLLERALVFLASRQDRSDGFFRMEGARGADDYRVGVSSLALLAFLGDGHCRIRGDHRRTVALAVDYLLAEQDPLTGRFGPGDGHYLYNHGIATCALLECYLLEKRLGQRDLALAHLRGAAQKALGFLLDAANETGGFGYTRADDRGDTSVTAWQLSALELARGLRLVPEERKDSFRKTVAGLRRWFASVTDEKGRVGYRARGSVKTYAASMTAVGLYCSTVLPGLYDKTTQKVQADLVLRKVPRKGETPDFYFWYYATTALHRLDPVSFRLWDARLRPLLLSLAREDGGFSHRTAYGATGGRVYATALAALMAEVYFRHG